jgi:hypothetical protein
MARISYIEENDHPELAELIGKIRAGRRGALINVYKLLLHSPSLAAIWLEFVSAARFKVARRLAQRQNIQRARACGAGLHRRHDPRHRRA